MEKLYQYLKNTYQNIIHQGDIIILTTDKGEFYIDKLDKKRVNIQVFVKNKNLAIGEHMFEISELDAISNFIRNYFNWDNYANIQ